MHQFNFFPSRQISWYMARLFLTRTFAVLAMLVAVLQTLDLLGESGDILAYAGNGDAQLWHYVALRAPQIVARFLPFSVLLGTLIMLATLNQNSEIISMKAAGLSAHQILAPLLAAAIGLAGGRIWPPAPRQRDQGQSLGARRQQSGERCHRRRARHSGPAAQGRDLQSHQQPPDHHRSGAQRPL
jgi:hypothetical protein